MAKKKPKPKRRLVHGRVIAYLPHVPSNVRKKVVQWVYVQRYNHHTHTTMNSFALVHEDDITFVQIKAPKEYVDPGAKIQVVLYPSCARIRPSKSYAMSLPRFFKERPSKVEDAEGML